AALEYVDEFYGVHNLTKLDPVAAADVLVRGANGLIHKLRRKSEQEKKEAELAALRATLAEQRKAVVESAKAAKDAMDAALSWRRRKQILDTPITGATIDDVTAAAEEIEAARQALQRARDAEDYQRQLAISETARKERDDAMKREAEVKRLAESIPSRLGELFDQAGIPNARVTDG